MNTSLRLAKGRPLRGTLGAKGRRSLGVGGAALVLAGLAPTAVAGAAPAPASSAAVGLPLVSGVLTGADGHPVAGQVSLMLDPGAKPVGTEVTVPVVASATAGADGRYQLTLAPDDPTVAAALAANHGWVNLMIVAEANGLRTMAETGRTSAANLASLASPPAAGSALPGPTWVDRAGAAPSVDFALAAGRPGVTALSPAQIAAGEAQTGAAAPPCRYTVADSQQAGTVVGEIHKWKDTTATFSYGQTADSDIGVGVNATGSGWSLSGTVHVSQSTSATVGWGGWAADGIFGGQLQTQFQYERRHWINAPGSTYCGVESIVAVGWNGGTSVGADVHQYDGHCDTSGGQDYKGGSFLNRDSSRAYRYYGAVNVFGVGLDAQSGYSSSVRMHWDFGTGATNHWMCGNDGPSTSAAIVYAGPNT